jgi:hypothetical protein
VALSRIKSLDGLYLLNFQPEKIKANPKVVAFYNRIQEFQENIVPVADVPVADVPVADVPVADVPVAHSATAAAIRDPSIKVCRMP